MTDKTRTNHAATAQKLQNSCDACNAPHANTLHRIWIRCGTCRVIPGSMPSNWKAKNETN